MSVLVFVFALVSGAEAYEGGFNAILRNSPNTIPWLIPLLLSIYAWKRKLLGGVLLILFGAFATYYFNFTGQNFFLSTFILCLSIILFGLIISVTELYLTKASSENS